MCAQRQACRIFLMMKTAGTKVDIKCPSCGQADVVVISEGSERKSVRGARGFIIAISGNNSLQIVCSNCHIAVYEAK
jgi:hypothetical protein